MEDKRYAIVYRWHDNEEKGWMRNIPGRKAAHEVIEEMQKERGPYHGYNGKGVPGISWQVCENDLVKCMVASTKI